MGAASLSMMPTEASPRGWALASILVATDGQTHGAVSGSERVPSVTTDSRQVSPGALFVALRGEHHDGHSFVATALRDGAAYALVDHLPVGVDPAKLIVVPDTLRALGDLAAWTRRQHRLAVCAITGSNGKTTTKEMLASICLLAQELGRVHGVLKTEGNFNNLIGLPLTLLRLADEDVAVLEMGMNRPGEIARLTEIAAPDLAVVTNVGLAHLEGVGGTIEGVARAKGELFATMDPKGAIAVNIDDARVVQIAAPFRGRKITFGSGGEVQSRAVADRGLEGLRFELVIGSRTAEVNLRMVGAHNVSNALAAAAVAHLLGFPIDTIAGGLSQALSPPERLQILRLRNGVTLVDDAYNANPSSVEVAMDTLQRMPGRLLVVLGDMRELGSESGHAHHRIGERAAASGCAGIYLLGEQAVEIGAGARQAGMASNAIQHCDNHEELAKQVAADWRSGDCVLVKGSHGMRLERVVFLLREYGDAT